jgi:hypothetical protein
MTRIFMAVLAVYQLKAQDYLIVPGVRVGPVRQSSTMESLRALPGVESKPDLIQIGEGATEPGLVLYPNDPSRRLEVVFRDTPPQTAAHVWICPPPGPAPACRWRTATGVGMGTTLRELERLNGKPFEMVGCCFDGSGAVVSFGGGKLSSFKDSFRLNLNLSPVGLPRQEAKVISGDKDLRSSHPLLRRLNPRVHVMRLHFPERP